MTPTPVPDYSRLFTLGHSFLRGALFLSADASGIELLCNSGLGRVPLKIVEGKRIYDWVPVGPWTFLVSSAAVDALTRIEATGWDVVERGAYGTVHHGLADHARLIITGRAGAIDQSKSRRERDSDNMPVLRGMRFHHDRSDGSDFVVPEDSCHIIVSERVRVELERAGLTKSLSFVRLSEYESPDYETFEADERSSP